MDMLDSDFVEGDFGDVATRNIGVEFCCISFPQSIDLTFFFCLLQPWVVDGRRFF